MVQTISRRMFLVFGGCALVTPTISLSVEVPSLLDHILLGCSDLGRGIEFVEESTGAHAAFGGVHPGAGTQNALLSLGDRRYLEIIAVDPAQPEADDLRRLKTLSEPRLVGWAAHVGDIQALAKRLAQSGVATVGPTPGSRKRPDGRVLRWSVLSIKDDGQGLLPFFIEWSADSLHPSSDSPKGCSLVRFEATTTDPDALSKKPSFSASTLELSMETSLNFVPPLPDQRDSSTLAANTLASGKLEDLKAVQEIAARY